MTEESLALAGRGFLPPSVDHPASPKQPDCRPDTDTPANRGRDTSLSMPSYRTCLSLRLKDERSPNFPSPALASARAASLRGQKIGSPAPRLCRPLRGP